MDDRTKEGDDCQQHYNYQTWHTQMKEDGIISYLCKDAVLSAEAAWTPWRNWTAFDSIRP